MFTEAETEKTSNGFSHFKALSGVTIEEFYKSHNHQKLQGKNDPNRSIPNKISDILKNPLTVVKFGELKKKIQSNIRESSKSKTDVLERQTMKWFFIFRIDSYIYIKLQVYNKVEKF